jgi:hypothetical protein
MTLLPDSEAVEKWEKLPKNAPSKQALPPLVFGGSKGWRWLLIVLAAVTIIGLLLEHATG